MRNLILIAAMAVGLAGLSVGTASAAPNCKTGVACGATCIAKGKVCHIATKPPVCKTGVACGNTCIAKGKVCHK